MCSTKGIARLLGRESTKKTIEFSDLHSRKTNIAGWKMGPLKMLYAYISSPLLPDFPATCSPEWNFLSLQKIRPTVLLEHREKKQVMIHHWFFMAHSWPYIKNPYCWWFRNPQQPPFGCKRTLVNNGINYQPQPAGVDPPPAAASVNMSRHAAEVIVEECHLGREFLDPKQDPSMVYLSTFLL